VVNPSGQFGNIANGQSDINQNSVGNTTTAGNISKLWVINANDPQTGTEYIISCPFTGTMGAATEIFNVGYIINGTFHNLAPVQNLTATNNIVGHINIHFKITATGVGGTFQSWSEGTINDATQNRFATTSWNCNGMSTGQAIDTTSPNTVSVAIKWGATSTGETVTGQSSTFTRYGG
jgi:hypothetical protein